MSRNIPRNVQFILGAVARARARNPTTTGMMCVCRLRLGDVKTRAMVAIELFVACTKVYRAAHTRYGDLATTLGYRQFTGIDTQCAGFAFGNLGSLKKKNEEKIEKNEKKNKMK